MIIGSCKIKLKIYSSYSLKDKRRILKGLMGKLKSRYNISIAEVEDNELWNIATIGIACVSNSKSLANEIVDKVIKFIDFNEEVEIIDIEIEML